MKASIIKSYKYIFIVIGVFTVSVFIYVYYKINPAGQDWMPKCPFHSMTGFHCPGCGSQRAIHDFLNGHILAGFKHNLLMGLGILVLLYKVFLLIRVRIYNVNDKNLLYHPKTTWIILIFIFTFWILRNIPYAPFTFLAP